MDASTQYALAYVLSSTAGLRVFLTLAAVSLAMHWGVLPPPPHQFAWLASDGALGVLIAATVLDFLGDKVPLVDHALQAVHTLLKPAAGALIGASVAPGGDPSGAIVSAVVGGASALAIHGVSATARAASTATTGGIGNPLMSVLEDALTVGALALAWFQPLVAAGVMLILTLIGVILLRKLIAYVIAHRERAVTVRTR